MRVSGYAQNNGIWFIGSRYRIRMTMKRDGDFTLRLKKNRLRRKRKTRKIKNPFEKIPLLRGVYKMLTGNPLMLLLAVLLLISELTADSQFWETPLNTQAGRLLDEGIFAASVLLFLAVMLRVLWRPGRTFQFHGAEHKTINAYQARTLTLEGVQQASRIARRCGTEMVVFLIPLFAALSQVLDSSLAVMFLSLAIAYELFNWSKTDKLPVLSWFIKLGYLIQKHIVTKEPTEAQLRAALAALIALLEAELSQER